MIVLNPITLPVAKMIGTMTTLIGDMINHDTRAPSYIVNDLVDSCRIGKVDYGKGIVNNFKVGLQPVEDLTETSTAFKITKPNIEQETIEIDTYKKIPISLSEILSHDAFLNGEGINSFFNFVMSLLEDTATFYLYDICNKKPMNKSYHNYHFLWADDYYNMTEKDISDYLDECNSRKREKKIICLETQEIFKNASLASEKYSNSGRTGGTHIINNCKGKNTYAYKLKDGTPLHWIFYDDFLKLPIKEQNEILSRNQESSNDGSFIM